MIKKKQIITISTTHKFAMSYGPRTKNLPIAPLLMITLLAFLWDAY